MAWSRCLAIVFVATLAACGSSTSENDNGGTGATGQRVTPPGTNDNRGFDRTCKSETDCVQVFSGDPCAPCDCTMDAVSSYEHEAYARDYEKRRDACPNKERVQCGPCALPAVSCDGGQCRIAK